jgi:hypothetical protein
LAFILGEKFGIIGIAVALSAPLLIVEPLYIRLSLSPRFLGMTFRSWWDACFFPVLSIVLPAALLAVISSLFTPRGDTSLVGLLPAAVFGVASLSMIFIRWKKLPFDELRSSLKAEF